jgi:putative membrane protein
MSEAGLLLSIVAVAGIYSFGVQQRWSRGRTGWAEAGPFFAGVVVVSAALVSPLDGLAHRSLWLHMIQHVLLVSVAAPLLALGRPLVVVREAWPRAVPAIRGPGVWTLVVVTAGVQVVTLLVWHVPALYDAALGHDVIHGTEHLTLLLTAVALWSALDAVRGEQGGLTLLALFIVSFPPLLLGAAMTFATTVWYPPYAAAGPHPLIDQQLAGVVMWAYGGLAAVIGGVYLFVRWLRALEQVSPGRPASARQDVSVRGTPSC